MIFGNVCQLSGLFWSLSTQGGELRTSNNLVLAEDNIALNILFSWSPKISQDAFSKAVTQSINFTQ